MPLGIFLGDSGDDIYIIYIYIYVTRLVDQLLSRVALSLRQAVPLLGIARFLHRGQHPAGVLGVYPWAGLPRNDPTTPPPPAMSFPFPGHDARY